MWQLFLVGCGTIPSSQFFLLELECVAANVCRWVINYTIMALNLRNYHLYTRSGVLFAYDAPNFIPTLAEL